MAENVKTNKYGEISRKYGDPWIWGIYLMLVVISIVESYSASSREIATKGLYLPLIMQCAYLAAGTFCVFVLIRSRYNSALFLYLMVPILAVFTVFCLVYVMKFGTMINGAKRAMTIIPGMLTLQPAEFAKLSIVTLLSYIFAKTQKNKDISNKGMIWAGFAVMVYGGLMIKSGLTNTLLLMAISTSMMLIGGAKAKKIVAVLLFFGVLFGCFTIIKSHNEKKNELMKELSAEAPGGVTVEAAGKDKVEESDRSGTWSNRIKEWMNRDSLVYRPITPKNQQEMFSRMAQAHGGLVGVGIGKSRECSRLPLAFSDYIYSIIVEELGLVGGIFVLLLYLSLLGRAAMIVRRSKRVLPSLLVIGMASFITFQALFHMAINVGVFPVSGQPLPLISKGGTSIIVISIAFGVMLSVSRTIANYGNKKNKVEETPIIEGLDAENPTEIPAKNVWK